jgi:sporulation protein YlmC with PRC-barrel domain
MKSAKPNKTKKHVISAVAVAGILSLGAAPAWAQRSNQESQTKQDAGENSGMKDGMITAGSLEGSKVVDKRNREVGSISNLFIDPQSGKIVRAGIDFNKETFGGEKYSVTWDQMSIKRDGNKWVVAVDESVLDRVHEAAKKDSGDQRQQTAGQTQQRKSSTQQQADRRSGGILGSAGGENKKDQKQIAASQLSTEQIRKIQQELNKEGFDAGQVDGKWNSETQSALRNFQESKGLRATGELDDRTIDELGLDADEFQQKSQTGNDRSYQKDQTGGTGSMKDQSYPSGSTSSSGTSDSSNESSWGSSR